MFHAPGAGGKDLAADVVVVDQLPVREHHAGEAELAPQQVSDDGAVVAEADLGGVDTAQGQPDRLGVVRHHGGDACGDRGRERLKMCLPTAAGVGGFRPVREMGVLAVADGAAAGEVLRRTRDAPWAEGRALHALQVGHAERRDDGRILPEGLGLPGPARLGGQVERRVQGGAEPDGGVLLPGDVGEATHQVGVAQCGETEHLGPLREGTRREAGPRVLGEGVAGIGGDGHRDAVRGGLGEFLQRVVPAGGAACVAQLVHVEVVHQLAGDHRGGRRLADGSRALHQRPLGA